MERELRQYRVVETILERSTKTISPSEIASAHEVVQRCTTELDELTREYGQLFMCEEDSGTQKILGERISVLGRERGQAEAVIKYGENYLQLDTNVFAWRDWANLPGLAVFSLNAKPYTRLVIERSGLGVSSEFYAASDLPKYLRERYVLGVADRFIPSKWWPLWCPQYKFLSKLEMEMDQETREKICVARKEFNRADDIFIISESFWLRNETTLVGRPALVIGTDLISETCWVIATIPMVK
jgi:hypothetical protein